jgi:hypothetical protein
MTKYKSLGDILLRMREVCCCGKKLYTLYPVILCTFTNYLLKTAKILGLSIIAIIIIVSPSLLKGYSACKFVFSLKVNIYLQNMRIEHTFTRFDFNI